MPDMESKSNQLNNNNQVFSIQFVGTDQSIEKVRYEHKKYREIGWGDNPCDPAFRISHTRHIRQLIVVGDFDNCTSFLLQKFSNENDFKQMPDAEIDSHYKSIKLDKTFNSVMLILDFAEDVEEQKSILIKHLNHVATSSAIYLTFLNNNKFKNNINDLTEKLMKSLSSKGHQISLFSDCPSKKMFEKIHSDHLKKFPLKLNQALVRNDNISATTSSFRKKITFGILVALTLGAFIISGMYIGGIIFGLSKTGAAILGVTSIAITSLLTVGLTVLGYCHYRSNQVKQANIYQQPDSASADSAPFLSSTAGLQRHHILPASNLSTTAQENNNPVESGNESNTSKSSNNYENEIISIPPPFYQRS
jgi:hypothetical protein